MANGTVVQPRVTGLTVVTLPGTEPKPVQMDKTDFKKLIDFRRSLLLPPPERPFPLFAAERIKGLLKSPKFSSQAVTELSKVLAAEEERRAEAEAARTKILKHIDEVIAEFHKEHPEEALLVWEGYLKDLKQLEPQVDVFKAELKATEKRIDELNK